MGTCWLHGANKSRLKTHHSFSRLPPETNTGHCNKIQYTPCPLASDLQYHVRATQSIVKVETAYQSTRRPQASHTFYSTYKIRLAITSSQLKVQLLLCNSSQYSCHSVAVASAANFPGISKQITEQFHDFAQS